MLIFVLALANYSNTVIHTTYKRIQQFTTCGRAQPAVKESWRSTRAGARTKQGLNIHFYHQLRSGNTSSLTVIGYCAWLRRCSHMAVITRQDILRFTKDHGALLGQTRGEECKDKGKAYRHGRWVNRTAAYQAPKSQGIFSCISLNAKHFSSFEAAH